MARISPTYYISPSAIGFTPNANGQASDIAVYVASGAQIHVYSPDIPALGYEDSSYQHWRLRGLNKSLSESGSYNIYARLDKESDNGLIVFSQNDYILSDNVTGSDVRRSDGSVSPGLPASQLLNGRSGYWWVKIGRISSASDGRDLDLDTGILGTAQYNESTAVVTETLLRIVVKTAPEGLTEMKWGGQLTLTASLYDGWTDSSTRVTRWVLSRESGDTEKDRSWNASHESFSGTVVLHYGEQQNDLRVEGRQVLFTLTAYSGDELLATSVFPVSGESRVSEKDGYSTIIHSDGSTTPSGADGEETTIGGVVQTQEFVKTKESTESDHAKSAHTLDDDSPVRNQFLRKDTADTASEHITFQKGLTSNDDVSIEKDLTVGGAMEVSRDIALGGSLRSDQEVHADAKLSTDGLLDADTALVRTLLKLGEETGWSIDNLGQAILNTLKLSGLLTGKDATFENLTVTKTAHFFQLVIDELKSQQGAVIITAANCEAGQVALVDGSDPFFYGMGWDGCYVVYFRAKDGDGKALLQSWKAGDQAICQSFNAASGTTYDAANKYYWRLVKYASSTPRTLSDGNDYHYIVLSNQTAEYDGSSTPAAGDHIVQLGYRGTDDSARQSAIILSAYVTPDSDVVPPSLSTYRGINDFSLSSHRATYFDAINADFIGNFSVRDGNSTIPLGSYISRQSGTYQLDPVKRQFVLGYDGKLSIDLAYYIVRVEGSSRKRLTQSEISNLGLSVMYLRGSSLSYSGTFVLGSDGRLTYSGTPTYDSSDVNVWSYVQVFLSKESTILNADLINLQVSASATLVVQQGLDAQIRAEVARAGEAETRIEAKADGLTSRVTDAEGNISELQQTAEEIHIGLRGNGEAGTNLLTKPDLTQANVQSAWGLSDPSGSGTASYQTNIGSDGAEEHVLQLDMSAVRASSGKAYSLSQSIVKVLEADTTYVASIYVRNSDYGAQSGQTDLIALLAEWAPTYMAVQPGNADDPAREGWYERSGSTYVPTDDGQVEDGKTYYCKASMTFVGSGYTGSNVTLTGSTTDDASWTRQLFSIKDTEWHRVWFAFKTPAVLPTTLRLTIRTHANSNAYGNAWQMELPKLELGTRPTSWSAMDDALKRTGIDISRGKIRLDSDTVEVAKDLTIGGHTRIGGWIYNEVNEISGNNSTAMSMNSFNAFGRSDVMNKWMTGDTSYDADFVDGRPVNNNDVIRFPECGANLLWSSDDIGELVLPFFSILTPKPEKNPYALKDYDTYSSDAWAESSYTFLNSLLKDPFGTALPYVGSRMLIRHTGGDSLYLYGVKGFGRVYHGVRGSYSAMIMEYDPWGYYTHVWTITELKDSIHSESLIADYVTRSMLIEAVAQARYTFLNWNGSWRSYEDTVSVTLSNGVSMKVAMDMVVGTSPMNMEGGEYVELRCTMADGEICWEIQDSGQLIK